MNGYHVVNEPVEVAPWVVGASLALLIPGGR